MGPHSSAARPAPSTGRSRRPCAAGWGALARGGVAFAAPAVGAGAAAAARARGRAAGAGHPRLPGHRPHDDGPAPRAGAGRVAGASVAAGDQQRAPRPIRWTCSSSGSTRSTTGGRCCSSGGAWAGCSRASWRSCAPDKVRAVVTLGSPFSGDLKTNTNVREFYERIAGHDVDQPPFPRGTGKPPVPTLALWSRKDGIVAPSAARGPRARGRQGGRDRHPPHGLRGLAPGAEPDGGGDAAVPDRGRAGDRRPSGTEREVRAVRLGPRLFRLPDARSLLRRQELLRDWPPPATSAHPSGLRRSTTFRRTVPLTLLGTGSTSSGNGPPGSIRRPAQDDPRVH